MQAQNLVQNPGFTGGLGNWTTLPASNYTVSWDGIQGNNAAGSAAISLTSAPAPSDSFFLSQCIPVLGSTNYDVGGSFRYPSGVATVPVGTLTLQAYSGPGCSGGTVGADNFGLSSLGAPADTWATQNYFGGWTTAPSAVSVKLYVVLHTTAVGLASGWFDDIHISQTTPVELSGFAID